MTPTAWVLASLIVVLVGSVGFALWDSTRHPGRWGR